MKKEKAKIYSNEFKEQILKECIEINEYGLVAKKYEIPPTTVYTWLQKYKNVSKKQQKTDVKKLKKQLDDACLEINILKELLKKTHQLWLRN